MPFPTQSSLTNLADYDIVFNTRLQVFKYEEGRKMAKQKLIDREIPFYTKGEEIFNMVSHIVGGAVGITALTLCVIFAALHGNVYGIVGSAIYGASMIILYTMSSIYHGLNPDLLAKRVFRIIDHCSIFILIAGTYTPICLVSLREYSPVLGWSIFGIVWGAAVLGITLNAIDLQKYKTFSAICYLVMGWCIIFAIKPTIQMIAWGGFIFLALGGVAYTIGALIYYKFKQKKYAHSIFHLFVVLASILQMFTILFYVV